MNSQRDVLPMSQIATVRLAALSVSFVDELDIALSEIADQRAAQILRMRLGIETGSPLTLRQIGSTLGVSHERVRQLEMKAYHRLRRAINATPEGSSIAEALTLIVGHGDEGWEDRTIQLAAMLLPDAAARPARRTIMALLARAPSMREQTRVAGYDRDTSWAALQRDSIANYRSPSAQPSLAADDTGHSIQGHANSSELSAYDAVRQRFGVEISSGPRRFERPGWFYTGPTMTDCPRCGAVLEGFRAPHRAKFAFYSHYWALACIECENLWSPSEIGYQSGALYNSSEHLPEDRSGADS